MKNKKLIYEIIGRFGGGFRVYLIPKHKRPHGVDGIELQWCSSKESKSKAEWHSIMLKDWEALSISVGLLGALLSKKMK